MILELVERTDAGPVSASGSDHVAIQVDELGAARRELTAAGLDPVRSRNRGADGPQTVTLVDPDGHHLELVQGGKRATPWP